MPTVESSTASKLFVGSTVIGKLFEAGMGAAGTRIQLEGIGPISFPGASFAIFCVSVPYWSEAMVVEPTFPKIFPKTNTFGGPSMGEAQGTPLHKPTVVVVK